MTTSTEIKGIMLADVCKGIMLADLIALIGSLDVDAPEIDR